MFAATNHDTHYNRTTDRRPAVALRRQGLSSGTGYHSVVCYALGDRAMTDKHVRLPKPRFPEETLIRRIQSQ